MLKPFAVALLVFSLVLPLNVNALTTGFTISTPKGPIGTSVIVNGTLGSQWASKNIVILFVNATIAPQLLKAGAGAVVASAITNSSGQFAASFFVPLVPKGSYNVSVRTEFVPYNFSQSPQPFAVTFGTDDLAQINASLKTLIMSLQSLQNTTSSLQTKLNGLKNNLTQIQSLIQGVGSDVSNQQAPMFRILNAEIGNINQSISNLNKRFADVNATLAANTGGLSRQEQLNLLSIIATVGVGAVILVVIQAGIRRKRPGIDNWDVFD